MKTLLNLILIAGALLLCACEKGDDNSQLPGVPPEKADAELTAFFEGNGMTIAQSFFWAEDEFGTLRSSLPFDTCAMINSDAQLEALGLAAELPEVDFGKYTLVVGQYLSISSINYLVGQSVVVEPGEIKAFILMNVKSDNLIQPVGRIKPYWGLYRKLPNLPILVIRRNN